MKTRFVRFGFALALASVTAACGNGTAPGERFSAPGRYELVTINGESLPVGDSYAPIAGSVYLWPNGHAERHVSYRSINGGTEEQTMIGSAELRGDSVTIAFHSANPVDSWVWIVRGTLTDGKLKFGYPGPADGWLLEEYHRR